MNTKFLIIAPSFEGYSETFIHRQIPYFKQKPELLAVGNDIYQLNGTPIMSNCFVCRVFRAIHRKLYGKSFANQQLKRLTSILRKAQITHALIHFGYNAIKVIDAIRANDIHLTVHFHGYDIYIQNPKRDKKYQQIFQFAHRIIAVSDHMKAKLQEAGALSSKIEVIPCGSDLKRISDQNSWVQQIKHFLFVGRFVNKKAPYLTVLAFAKAFKSNSELRLTMVGDGPLLDSTISLARSLLPHDKIEFTGALPHNDVQVMINKADVLIQHSIQAGNGDSEGSPVSIMEAIGIRKPVISTLHTGIPEIVENQKNGLLSDEGDIHAMAENIIKITNPEIYNEMVSYQSQKFRSLEFQTQELEKAIFSS